MTDDTPNYSELSPPDNKSPQDYTYAERRAEIYRMIEDAGHPRNLERSQRELAKRYGCTQQNISNDFQRLREYEVNRNGNRNISMTRWLGSKAVRENVEQASNLKSKAEDLEKAGDIQKAANLRERAANLFSSALDNQMEFNEFLFKLGELEEAPDELHVTGEAGDMYMEMLRQAHEDEDE